MYADTIRILLSRSYILSNHIDRPCLVHMLGTFEWAWDILTEPQGTISFIFDLNSDNKSRKKLITMRFLSIRIPDKQKTISQMEYHTMFIQQVRNSTINTHYFTIFAELYFQPPTSTPVTSSCKHNLIEHEMHVCLTLVREKKF